MCCISAGFAKIATPCVACTKVVGSAFAVGLIFTFNFFGIDIEGDWPIVLILLAGFFALIWFLIVYCSGVFYNKKLIMNYYIRLHKNIQRDLLIKNMMNLNIWLNISLQCVIQNRLVHLKHLI